MTFKISHPYQRFVNSQINWFNFGFAFFAVEPEPDETQEDDDQDDDMTNEEFEEQGKWK